MPTSPTGDRKSVTLVLRKLQHERLKQLAADQTTPNHEVFVSDIAREVVDLGLAQYPDAENCRISRPTVMIEDV